MTNTSGWRDFVLSRDLFAFPSCIEFQAMVAAANALPVNGAETQGQRTVAAAVFQRGSQSALGAKKHDRKIEKGSRDPLSRSEVGTPASHIPIIIKKLGRFGRDGSSHDSLLKQMV